MIILHERTSLGQALRLTRFYEQTSNVGNKRNASVGGQQKFSYSSNSSTKNPNVTPYTISNTKVSMLANTKTNETMQSKPRPLTYTEREKKRQKGLYFYCDERFVKGHEYKKPPNFSMV